MDGAASAMLCLSVALVALHTTVSVRAVRSYPGVRLGSVNPFDFVDDIVVVSWPRRQVAFRLWLATQLSPSRLADVAA